MKKYINKVTIVLSVLVCLCIVVVIILSLYKKDKNFIVIDNNIFEYNDKYVFKKAELDDVVGYSFRMIYQNKYIGNHVFDHKDEQYNVLYYKQDDKENAIKTPYIGINHGIVYYDLVKNVMDEDDFEIYKSLSGEEINYELNDLSYADKYEVEDKNITVYTVVYEADNPDEDYSIVFVKNGDDYVVLDEDLPQQFDGGYKFTIFEVNHILDINNDNKLEMIVGKSYYDITEYSIYKLYDNFEELFYTGE